MACPGQAPEDLHGGLGVGVVGRLEAQLRQAQALEELFERAYEVAQGESSITDHACRPGPGFRG